SPAAERLLTGISVYREPADQNALLFQAGEHDWTAARDGGGCPAPPYRAPAGLAALIEECTASGLLTVVPPDPESPADPAGQDRPGPPRPVVDPLSYPLSSSLPRSGAAGTAADSAETAELAGLKTAHVPLGVTEALRQMLVASGREAELTAAHQRAAEYWQWRAGASPQSRADVHDLIEGRFHLI